MLARLVLATVLATLLTTAAFAAPARIIILRHGEKANPWKLCDVGTERANALADTYLGRNATKSLFANGEEPAFFFAITLHTLELAGPSAASWSKPLILYSVVPDESDDDDLHVKALNRRTQEAAANIMQNPALNGKTIVMVWEHKHIANAKLEAKYEGEAVTLRKLLKCCLACHRPGPATITTTFGSSIIRRTPTYRPTSPWQSSVIPISPCRQMIGTSRTGSRPRAAARSSPIDRGSGSPPHPLLLRGVRHLRLGEAMAPRCFRRQLEEAVVELNETRAVAYGDDRRVWQPREEQAIKLRFGRLVQGGCCLVQEQPIGLLQKRAGDRQPLLLASRQLVGPIGGHVELVAQV